jgi:hypothetical protein
VTLGDQLTRLSGNLGDAAGKMDSRVAEALILFA